MSCIKIWMFLKMECGNNISMLHIQPELHMEVLESILKTFEIVRTSLDRC